MEIRGFDVRFVPMSVAAFQTLLICAAGADDPYVKVIFHDDPTITVYYQAFDALTVGGLIAALELARDFARNGPDWRG